MKFAKKLKSIKAGEYLNQDRILQVLSAADGISDYLPKISNPISQITVGSMWRSPQKIEDRQIIGNVPELVETRQKEGEEEEASGSFVGDEENVRPPVNQIPRVPCDRKDSKPAVSCGSGFRRPDLNSTTLFDPKLLEAFELALVCLRRIDDFSRVDDEEDVIFFSVEEESIEKDENALSPVIGIEEEEDSRKDENVLLNDAQRNEGSLRKDDNALQIVNEIAGLVGEDDSGKDGNTLIDPLLEFEDRCPPGGEESVVFYTTTLRGIRKTFDDCNMIRFLLDSFKVKYYERDVSMHREYREELRRVSAAEETEVLPPVLFVKGRCIGGAQRVLGLHEQGKFRVLFDGVPLAGDERCRKCDGIRFLMCEGCRGSRRIISGDGTRIQCLLCNENGLIVCVDCS